MKTTFDHIRDHLLSLAGYINRLPDLNSLRQTEWSSEFERGMRKRLIMGAIRYRLLYDPEADEYDNISSAIEHLKKYQKDGNMEHLFDVANLCLIEFVHGVHPCKHLKLTDDTEHAKLY